MAIVFTPILNLALIPVGHDGATAANERNNNMTKLDSLFALNVFSFGAVIFGDGFGKLTEDASFLVYNKVLHRLGIGNAAPSNPLHVTQASGAAVQVRLTDSITPTDVTFSARANVLDIDVFPASVSTATSLRLFRLTTTTGAVQTIFLLGNGSAVANAAIGSNLANTYFCANNGSMGVGTSAINASAILDIRSTTQGVIFPQMTTAQRDAMVGSGLGVVIFNTTTSKLQCRFSGTSWADLH